MQVNELIYIRNNYQTKTIEEMADHLGKRPSSLEIFCKVHGMTVRWANKEKNYTKKRRVAPPAEKKAIERPPAVYSNSPSPYGVYDQYKNNDFPSR